ncbi:MAG TPA: aldehyde dehydrogenase family protein, partial [Candidatus Krumholzibacteria bacterium]|nr:aldehyde dehydrogenase family protein [Candidatus Krumholzibacteria bacterium]
MANGILNIPMPGNEPVRMYEADSEERASLKAKLKQLMGQEVEIPLVIGGERIKTGSTGECRMPHDHSHLLGRYHKAGPAEIEKAVAAAHAAHARWNAMSWESRAAIFLKAADLLAGPWRDTINAATMLCQSKNVLQAEIDSACELIDFFR